MKDARNLLPIFIGGSNRSGTTMLGSMLGTHSNILGLAESQYVLDIYKRLYRLNKLNSPTEIIDSITQHPRFILQGIDIKDRLLELRSKQRSYNEIIFKLLTIYSTQIGKQKAQYWVEHVPSNIKETSLLLELFPNAKFIHVVRDGRAVAASLKSVNWGEGSLDQIAQSWVNYIAHGLAAESALGSEKIIRVYYETLVREPEKTLERIVDFVGVKFEPGMVRGAGLDLPGFYRTDQRLVGSTPDESRINAWQRKLKPREVEIFENFAGDLLAYFGYTPKYFPFAVGPGFSDRLKYALDIPRVTFGNYYSHIKLFFSAKAARRKSK
jgi:hypothetical protein